MSVAYTINLRKIDVYTFHVVDLIDMWTVGWGQASDQDSELQNELQWVEVARLTNEECKIFYGNQINDNTLCVEGNYNEGTCYVI
jgi:hypothetical protein